MAVPKVFKRFLDVEDFVKSLKEEQSQPLKIRVSRTVADYNSKLKNTASHVPEELKYYSISYTCKHHGSFKSRGKGIRASHRVLPSNCPYVLEFKYNRVLKGFVISKHLDEHNHPIGKELMSQYRENRKLNAVEQAEAIAMLSTGSKPAVVRSILAKKTNKIVKVKDLHNLKSKKRNESPEIQKLDVKRKKLSRYDKFAQATEVVQQIAFACSELPMEDFNTALESLKQVLKVIQKKETLIISSNNVSTEARCDDALKTVASIYSDTDDPSTESNIFPTFSQKDSKITPPTHSALEDEATNHDVGILSCIPGNELEEDSENMNGLLTISQVKDRANQQRVLFPICSQLPKARCRKTANMVIPFRNKSLLQKARVMLEWFVDGDIAKQALRGKISVEVSQVEPIPANVSDGVMDQHANLSIIEHFFTPDAWMLVENIVAVKKTTMDFHCRSCSKKLPETCNSIACDACLSWFHWKCVDLIGHHTSEDLETMTWFCSSCTNTG